MTIEEFTKQWYPDDYEREALYNFIKDCISNDSRNRYAIFNTLIRNDVRSIRQLRDITEDELRKFRCIGEKRLELIMELKKVIDECVNE